MVFSTGFKATGSLQEKNMRFMAIKRMKNKIRKKLSGQTGFSLGELLAATLILLLASQVLAQGITFAVRMYNESLTISHGKQLCSTLTNVVETELRYTTSIKIDSSNTLQNYFSPTYGQTKSSFSVIDSEGNLTNNTSGGELAIQITDQNDKPIWQKLISSASYSSYDLKAQIGSVIYSDNKFHVILMIMNKNGKNLVTNEFDVIPVNKLTIR